MEKFEKDLQEIFDGAEYMPSESVWAGIEAGLATKKKKRIFVYWQTYGVAAGLILVLSLGYLFSDSIFGTDPSQQNPTNKTQANSENSPKDNSNSENNDTDSAAETKEEIVPPITPSQTFAQNDQSLSPSRLNRAPFGEVGIPENSAVNPADSQTITLADQPVNSASEAGLPEAIKFIDYQSQLTNQLRWEAINLIKPMPELEVKQMVAQSDSRALGLSGGLAGGSFNPNIDQNSTLNLAATEGINDTAFNGVSRSATHEENEPGGSLSAGIGLGFELSNQLMLRTGLQFSQQRFRNTSNVYSVENGVALPVYAPAGFDDTETFFPGQYNLENTLSTLTVPVQLSYRVARLGNFTIRANAGFAFDYYLSYRIRGDLNFLEVRKVQFGDNNVVFNRLNVNLLGGLEFNYQLNPKFGVGLDAYFRKNTTGVVSGEGNVLASPVQYGFGISLNYLLRKK